MNRGAVAVAERWVPQGRMSLASIAEAAALAGLPAEPAAYGLPGAASRRRPATRDIFRASSREVDHRNPSPADPDTADEQPTVWSTP
jgi:hypothetical protein